MLNPYSVSMIIPVYNTREYLRPCLDSVIRQQCFARCEVLLADDGSTDGSGEILAEYASGYPNIRVLTYDAAPWNRGPSAARNLGLRVMSGEYVFFLDSDDLLEDGYLDKLLAAAEKTGSEIVYAGFSEWTDGVVKPVPRKALECAKEMSGPDYLGRRMEFDDEYNYACAALYRVDFLRRNGLLFEEDIRFYEDVPFSWRAMLAAKRVSTLQEYGYYYRQREGSLIHKKQLRLELEYCVCVLERMSDFAREGVIPREGNRFFYPWIRRALMYIGYFGEEGTLDKATRKEYYRRLDAMADWRSLWKAAGNWKERMKWLVWRLNWGLYYPIWRMRNLFRKNADMTEK